MTIQSIYHYLFPPKCYLCLKLDSLPHSSICLSCSQNIQQLSIDSHALNRYHCDQLLLGFRYEKYIQELIINYKFNKKIYLSKTIAELMIPLLKKYQHLLKSNSIIIPMPSERMRLAIRGFNPTHLFAYEIARYLSIPYDANILKKQIFTLPQSTLSKKNRQMNLTNSFICKKNLCNKNIILIDDVLTTGKTLEEAVKVLKKNNVNSVTSIIFAKA